MADTPKICVVTTSRADYGIYQPLLRLLQIHPGFELSLVVGGQHLEPRFGSTVELIENDGYLITGRVSCFAGDDNPLQTVAGISQALEGFAKIFGETMPDLVIVLGDRYEMFAAATAAYTLGIPIAHIAGGDVTTGALDDAYRHSITKMATIHFTTSQKSTERVVAMGEHPDTAFTVGTPALDHISTVTVQDREELTSFLGFELPEKFLLVTFHPETTSRLRSAQQVAELIAGLNSVDLDVGVLITGPNADPGSADIRAALLNWVESHDNAYFIESLGVASYLNAVSLATVVVGNSSSAIYEAPALGTWSIDIGDRQNGRERAPSVINVPLDSHAIAQALKYTLNESAPLTKSPYGDGNAAQRIVDTLEGMNLDSLVTYGFYESGSK